MVGLREDIMTGYWVGRVGKCIMCFSCNYRDYNYPGLGLHKCQMSEILPITKLLFSVRGSFVFCIAYACLRMAA